MQTISILIADDNPMVRQCLRRAVEADPQLEIRWEAENGLQALMLAEKHSPDLILMDAQMPRMDGIEATRCLRQKGAQPVLWWSASMSNCAVRRWKQERMPLSSKTAAVRLCAAC